MHVYVYVSAYACIWDEEGGGYGRILFVSRCGFKAYNMCVCVIIIICTYIYIYIYIYYACILM